MLQAGRLPTKYMQKCNSHRGGAKGIPSTMTVFEMFLLAPLCCSIAGPSFCRHLRVGMDWIKLFKATKPKACANTTQRKS